jgi:hypothetical protein
MKSVADELRAESIAATLAMTPDERVALAFRLGDQAIADLARTRGISEEEAAWLIRAQRRAGRRYSRCIEELEGERPR